MRSSARTLSPTESATMNTEALIQRFHDRTGAEVPEIGDPDSLIGFFQNFRPDGKALDDLFGELGAGPDLSERLASLYEVAGDDRRPQGGRDAYFVVRNPPALDPDLARQWGTDWLSGLRDIALSIGDQAMADALDPVPSIRVLEGIPPKHPKIDVEKCNLLQKLQINGEQIVDRIEAGSHPAALRPAYYFIACDAMLRDYLMWPLYASASGHADPLLPYFHLWRHGVKWRVFQDEQVDLYLPRSTR